VFSLCREIGEPLPLLWYWPDDVPAVALLSHDTDGNVEALGWQELEAVERHGIRSSWCFIRSPETYPLRLYQTVAEHGHEVCLHYDAHSTAYPDATFSEASFQDQLRWLRHLLPETAITSNKNHYLRWEGWTEPWRWMEAGGISVDQCKGPSKKGNCGFLFGGSHPWFPIEDAAHGSRLLDVLEINLFAQDLIVAAPPELAEPLILRTRDRGGVAHFLFHPAHVAKPGVADAMGHTIAFARQHGMQWWTSDRIGRWERDRRQMRLSLARGRLEATAAEALPSATVLVLDTGPHQDAGWERVERWGFPFWRRVADLPGELAFDRTGTS
jgi:peptidoglycan/xylan/chitin deacetylase (PgdA/CDA1 family)